MIYATSSKGWINQLLGTPFFHFTKPALDLYRKGIHAFSSNYFVLNNLSPYWGNPIVFSKISSGNLKVKLHIVDLSPSNERENSRLTFSLYPLNFSKKGIHYFLSKISTHFSWIAEESNFPGSSLETIFFFYFQQGFPYTREISNKT